MENINTEEQTPLRVAVADLTNSDNRKRDLNKCSVLLYRLCKKQGYITLGKMTLNAFLFSHDNKQSSQTQNKITLEITKQLIKDKKAFWGIVYKPYTEFCLNRTLFFGNKSIERKHKLSEIKVLYLVY